LTRTRLVEITTSQHRARRANDRRCTILSTDSRTPTISRESLQQAAGRLRRLAEKRKPESTIPHMMTRPHLVKALRREIAAAFKQGYVVEDIVTLLTEQGIDIEATTFRRYWRRAKSSPSRSISSKPRVTANPEKTSAGKLGTVSHRANCGITQNVEQTNDAEHPD
jgi:hypothetical protein